LRKWRSSEAGAASVANGGGRIDVSSDTESVFATAGLGDDGAVGQAFRDETAVGIEIAGRRFTGCSFVDCDFEESRFVDCHFVGCRFANCTFRDAVFLRCRFGGGEREATTPLNYCDLSRARFEDCRLASVAVVGCTAVGTTFEGCASPGLKFDATLHRSIGKKKIVGGVTFHDCRLQFSTFAPGDYEASRFEGCDLRDVDFSGGDYTRASFRGSVLHNAAFDRATLDEADLRDTTFDSFPLLDVFSHRGLVVSRDGQEAMLAAIGIVVG
jgi:fluoroquinolone resistance protein